MLKKMRIKEWQCENDQARIRIQRVPNPDQHHPRGCGFAGDLFGQVINVMIQNQV